MTIRLAIWIRSLDHYSSIHACIIRAQVAGFLFPSYSVPRPNATRKSRAVAGAGAQGRTRAGNSYSSRFRWIHRWIARLGAARRCEAVVGDVIAPPTSNNHIDPTLFFSPHAQHTDAIASKAKSSLIWTVFCVGDSRRHDAQQHKEQHFAPPRGVASVSSTTCCRPRDEMRSDHPPRMSRCSCFHVLTVKWY